MKNNSNTDSFHLEKILSLMLNKNLAEKTKNKLSAEAIKRAQEDYHQIKLVLDIKDVILMQKIFKVMNILNQSHTEETLRKYEKLSYTLQFKSYRDSNKDLKEHYVFDLSASTKIEKSIPLNIFLAKFFTFDGRMKAKKTRKGRICK